MDNIEEKVMQALAAEEEIWVETIRTRANINLMICEKIKKYNVGGIADDFLDILIANLNEERNIKGENNHGRA